MNAAKSEEFDVDSGVGQGSILASIFFLVFFNDFNNHTGATRDIDFADDKKTIRIRISTIEDTLYLQTSINNFSDWCTNNGFELNEDKCKIMSITRKRCPILANYTILFIN